MIVLDTHAWIWWATADRRLSRRASRAIESDPYRGVSPVSCFEVARLVVRGRLGFDRPVESWLRSALARPELVVLDAVHSICMRAAQLGDDLHGDPFDRIIVATAIEHDAPLVTKDERIRRFRGVPSIW